MYKQSKQAVSKRQNLQRDLNGLMSIETQLLSDWVSCNTSKTRSVQPA